MTSIQSAKSLPVSSPQLSDRVDRIRKSCVGDVPLDARLEPWMVSICSEHRLHPLVGQYGSPLNVLCHSPFERNLHSLRSAASSMGVNLEVYFARKANKCLIFVDAAHESRCGIDTASPVELEQVLARGVPPHRIVSTAAIKTEALIRECVRSGVVIAVDNLDELQLIRSICRSAGRTAEVALRVSGFEHQGEKLHSRFGFDIDDVVGVVQREWSQVPTLGAVNIAGLHFHLDGYCPDQRISAIQQSLALIDAIRTLGHRPEFLDIGGGIPMSYLESEQQWIRFWSEHRRALLGERPAITYGNHGLGFLPVGGRLHGTRRTYPYFQSPVQAGWLKRVLGATSEQGRLADAIRSRNLQLRCEPGRSVLDGCGLTVARVEYRKQHRSGDWLIGLAMNRTQCRTSSDDFLVDPLLIRQTAAATTAIEGYLVGAYCTESELLTLRRLRFPQGVAIGDLIVFPNTAGYLMHFLESRSHQFPLAKNVVVDGNLSQQPRLDAIDVWIPRETTRSG